MIIVLHSSSSHDNGKKTDTSLFVQRPYLRSEYIEADIEENIDSKNQFKTKNLPDLFGIREGVSKDDVDNKINKDIDFRDKNLNKKEFVKVNYQPAKYSHSTAKTYVDNAIDEISLVRNIQDDDFNIHKLTNIKLILL